MLFPSEYCRFHKWNGWLRYFARDCGCLEKSENPQRENCPAELPRQTTNRGRNLARVLPPADTHPPRRIRKFVLRGKFWIFNTRRREASEIRGARRTVAGAWNNFISPISFFSARVIRRRKTTRGWKGEGVASRRYFLLAMRLAFRTTPSYPAGSRRDFAETVLGTLQIFPWKISRRYPRGLDVFRWIDWRVLPLCKLPFRFFFFRTISPETKPLQARPFPTSPRSTIESTELRLHSCESFVLQSLARRIVRQTRKFR